MYKTARVCGEVRPVAAPATCGGGFTRLWRRHWVGFCFGLGAAGGANKMRSTAKGWRGTWPVVKISPSSRMLLRRGESSLGQESSEKRERYRKQSGKDEVEA